MPQNNFLENLKAGDTYLVGCQVHFCDEGPADGVLVADDNTRKDDIVHGVGDVASGDNDEGVEEAGHGGLDKEYSQTK